MLGILNDREQRLREEIFMEFGRYEVAHDYFGGFQPLRCIFDGRYKLAVNLLSSDELDDLEKDPQEMENLIEKEEYAKIRCRPWRADAAPKSWNDSGMTRQKEPDYDEEGELRYIDAMPAEPASYPVILPSAK